MLCDRFGIKCVIDLRNKRIEVRLLNGEIIVTNVHIGALGDILAYPIDVAPDLDVTKIQLLDAILNELSSDGFRTIGSLE